MRNLFHFCGRKEAQKAQAKSTHVVLFVPLCGKNTITIDLSVIEAREVLCELLRVASPVTDSCARRAVKENL